MAPATSFKISRSDLQSTEVPAFASISNVKHLASYNWLDTPSSTPTIAVPGSPPLWMPPKSEQRLPRDSGRVYIAQNEAQHPESPLEPLFRALFIEEPSFDISSVDLVTDRNNIRKLLSFIDPRSNKGGLEEFTINVEIKDNTAIFGRVEAKATDFIGPEEFRGYGREFEKAYTTSRVTGSTSHHRIISYQFGGLNVIVRHETDGYVNDTSSSMPLNGNNSHLSDLSGMLGSLSLASGSTQDSKLKIQEEGQRVSMDTTLEIKTRVFHKPIDMDEVAAQIWISQTPKLVRAYHRGGAFQCPAVEDVARVVKNWEQRKQAQLRQLACLFRQIIKFVKDFGGNAVAQYDVHSDQMIIRKAENKRMLPADLYLKWKRVQVPEAELGSTVEPKQAPLTNQYEEVTKGMNGNGKAAIKVGDQVYNIDVEKVPYFARFVREWLEQNPTTTAIVHEPIKLFDVALNGIEKGYRQCIRSLGDDLTKYPILFGTYKLLGTDIPNGLSLDQVIANLKAGRDDFDPEERCNIRGNKSKARDSAFQFLYLMMQTSPEAGSKEIQRIYNAVLFVVSHPHTFKSRTRKLIQVAYQERFTPTLKQRLIFEKWEKENYRSDSADETTEDDFYDNYDSDDYFFGSDCS